MSVICNKDNKIKFVKGDSFTREYEVKGVDLDYIESIQVTCNDLNLQKVLLPNEEGVFTLFLTSKETSKMPDIHTTYDLSVVFIDKSVQTIVYNGQFVVLPKENRVVITHG